MINDIKSIDGYESMTAAEIAVFLQADPRTVRDIPTADARELMRERDLWLKDPIDQEMRHGKIGEAMVAEGFSPTLRDALVELNSALYEQSADYLRTHSLLEKATEVYGAVLAMESLAIIDADDVTAFYALGGGRLYENVTAEQVQEALDNEDLRIAAEIASENQRVLQGSINDLLSIEAMQNVLSDQSKTAEQIKAAFVSVAEDVWGV